MAKTGPASHGRWARMDYWMAGVADRLDQLMYLYLKVNGGKPDEPTPTPRPGLVASVHGDVANPPDPELIALLEQRRAERRQQQEATREAPADAGASLACGCPHSVLETGHHIGGCSVLDALQPPEQE